MKHKLIGSNDYSIDILQTIAENRGLKNIQDILGVGENDYLSPFVMKNMKKAVEALAEAMNNDKNIHILADVDTDGYTSGTIMYKYLKRSYNENKITWSINTGKKHGIYLDELKDYNFDVLIVPDAGSEDYEAHKTLHEKGVLVIVLDHHMSKGKETPAIIVNPQLDNYPNKAISGAGVTYKFCQAIDSAYNYTFSEGLEDLASMGLVADVMDTREKDTRYLITKGVNSPIAPIIQSFVEVFDKVEKFDISSISYYFAPLVNAVIRLGTEKEKRKLFRAFIDDGTPVFADAMGGFKKVKTTFSTATLNELRDIKRMQDEIRDKLVLECNPSIEEQLENPVLYHIFDDYEYRNFSGLVAGQLADQNKKPCFILYTDKDGKITGSGRNYEKFPLQELKTFCENSNQVSHIGGHEAAFGIGFEDVAQAKEFFNNINLKLSKYNGLNYHTVDFIIKKDKISKEIVNKISLLNDYYGYKFEEPLILIENIPLNIKDITVNKAFTMLKFNINKDITGVRFRDVEKVYNEMVEANSFMVDIVGKVNINHFAGRTSYQFFIEDYEIKVDKNPELCYNKDKELKFKW